MSLKSILFYLSLFIWVKVAFTQSWSPPIRISPESMEVYSVKLTVDHQGRIWCVWDLWSSPAHNRILTSYYENEVWSKPDTVMPDTIYTIPGTIDIAVDKNGNLWVVAGDDPRIFARYFNGTQWSNVMVVPGFRGCNFGAKCAVDSLGNFWVAWVTDYFFTYQIYSSYYNGEGWSDLILVSGDTCADWIPPGGMTVDRDGAIWIIWSSRLYYPYYLYKIHTNVYRTDSWSEPILLYTDSLPNLWCSVFSGEMTTSYDGLVWASWYEEQDASTAYIYTAYYDTGWSNPILVTTTSHTNWIIPVMASDAQNRVWLAWNAMPERTPFIYYSIWDGSAWSEPALVDTLSGRNPAIVYDPYRDRIWVAFVSRREGYPAVYVSYTQATGVEERHEDDSKCQTLKLQVFPIPFNQVMQIHCTLPRSSKVLMKIYDISGRLVKTLVDEKLEGGLHTLSWDGKDELRKNVPAGIYFLRMETSEYKATKKLLLMR